jgi:drug/metabolite transporter (DMT)-like permease
MLLLARAPAGPASNYSFENPVIAMPLGVMIAGETVTRSKWVALSVVLAGVLLLLWRRVR